MTDPGIAAVLELHGWPDTRKYRRHAEEILRRKRRFGVKPFKHQDRDVAPMMVAADLILRPVEDILALHESKGVYTIGPDGYVVFLSGDGKWYGAAGGLEGLIWHFEMMETRHGLTLPLEPMRAMYECLAKIEPIGDELIDQARASLAVLRRAITFQQPDDAVDLLGQAKIREALEAIKPEVKP